MGLDEVATLRLFSPLWNDGKKRDGNCITFPKMVVAQGPSSVIFFFLPHLKNCHNQFEWIMFIVTKCLNAKTLKNWGVRHHCEAVRILIRWVTKHMLCVDFIKNALWADVPCITFSYEVVVRTFRNGLYFYCSTWQMGEFIKYHIWCMDRKLP